MAEGNHLKQNGDKAMVVQVRLKPAAQADQPILVNYTNVGLIQGLAYVDFGFLEPALLGTVAHRAQKGESLPKNLEGARAARVALPLDAAIRLHQQLQQVLVGIRPPTPKQS
jgi:hypothetical protein